MLGDQQDQSQTQNVVVGENELGITKSVYCEFFTSSAVNAIQRVVNRNMANTELSAPRDLQKAKQVIVYFFKDKVVKVCCHFHSDGKCGSELNESGKCHLF